MLFVMIYHKSLGDSIKKKILIGTWRKTMPPVILGMYFYNIRKLTDFQLLFLSKKSDFGEVRRAIYNRPLINCCQID